MNRLVGAIAIMTILASGTASATARATRQTDSSSAAQENCVEAPLAEYGGSGVQGTAQLCANDDGVRAVISAQELTEGEAYTVWFLYFDRPTACSATPCGVPDMSGDDPLGVVVRVDGLIGDDTGEAEFSGTFRDLRLSRGSEAHLGIVAHGPASVTDNRMLARQLLTPQMPMLGAPGMGAVADGDVGHPVAVAILSIPNDGV